MKKLQEKVEKFCEENGFKNITEYVLLDLVSEIGEVSKEVLKSTDDGRKQLKYTPELKDELGDSFYSLILVANTLNIDLEEALDHALEKYKRRLKNGSAGSESEK